MKKIILFLLLFVLPHATLQAQGKKLDSLRAMLKLHPTEDTVRVKLLRSICFYESSVDLEACRQHAEEALALSKKLNYVNGIGFSYRYLAQYFEHVGEFGRAMEYALEMRRTFEPTGNSKGKGQALCLLGVISEDSGDSNQALAYYRSGLDLFKKANLKIDVGYTLNQITSIFLKLNEYDSAEKYSLEGLKVRSEIGDLEGMTSNYANLGAVYVEKGQNQKAIENIMTSFKLMEQLNLVDDFRSAVNFGNLGIAYARMGEYNEAEASLDKAEQLAKGIVFKSLVQEIYEHRIELEKLRGNYKDALRFDEMRDRLRDSLFNEQKTSELARVQTRYEVEKKDQTIASLQQQEQVQNLKQWLLLGGLVLFAAVSAVIYFLQRSNNRRVKNLLLVQQDLNTRLKETDRMKSRFFANISHEFRTPLSLIITPTEDELRRNQALAPGIKKLFMMVNRNAHQLRSLVNELLDLSKLDAGKMELQVRQGDLANLVSLTAASFDSLAESKQIIFKKNITLAANQHWFDGEKVNKILNNLLINAFKFTPTGKGVTLNAEQGPGSPYVTFTVADQGIGIAPDEQPHVFSSYYQVRGINSDLPGTGLGLALVKELVELYHGKITLKSIPREGTTITVILPATATALSHASFTNDLEISNAPPVKILPAPKESDSGSYAPDDDGSQKLTVLVVEDHEELRNFITSVFADHFSVITAEDGEEGLLKALEHVPDIVVSDVMMPKMSGVELLEKLKDDERTSHVPVILLTAKADLDSRLTGLKTGADDYLEKPFSTEELLVRAHNLTEQRKKLAEKYKSQLEDKKFPFGSGAVKEQSLDEKFLSKANEVVVSNIGNVLFSVEDFAAEMNLSRTQLFRKLKAMIGLSPNEFINELRLQRAAEMIVAKSDTLSQISYAVGFNEYSYFAKRFKLKFGVPPGEFNANLLSDRIVADRHT